MATETRYEVIPAGYTPEDWHAYGPGIMARLRSELDRALASEPVLFKSAEMALPDFVECDSCGRRMRDMSGHRTSARHDCFAMNCRDVGRDLELLQDRLVAAETRAVVHTYKGEGLTACGLEVVGPCPDCEHAT